jgi:hypothetical protein
LISTVSGTLFTTLKIGPCCSKRLPVLKPGRGFFQSTQLVAVRSLICPDGKAPHHGGLALPEDTSTRGFLGLHEVLSSGRSRCET